MRAWKRWSWPILKVQSSILSPGPNPCLVCAPILTRQGHDLSGSQTALKGELRRLYKLIHPDLLHNRPVQQATNQKSFQLLQEYLTTAKGGESAKRFVYHFEFYIRSKASDDSLEKVEISLPPPQTRGQSVQEHEFLLTTMKSIGKIFAACGLSINLPEVDERSSLPDLFQEAAATIFVPEGSNGVEVGWEVRPASALPFGASSTIPCAVLNPIEGSVTALDEALHSAVQLPWLANPMWWMQSISDSNANGLRVKIVDVPGYIDDFSHRDSHEDRGHSIVIEALENFLQKHKNLQPKDAQLISRNCPAYISKVEAANSQRLTIKKGSKDEDRIRIEHWLMGNMNELEPFLESIGLDPEKVEEVLPFVQMPLDGEQGLLRNVEILEGMGISRGSLWDVLEQNKQLLAMDPADLRATVDFLEGLGVKRSKEMVGPIEDSFFLTDGLETLKTMKEAGVQKHAIAKILKSDSPWGGRIDMPVGSFRTRVEFLVKSGLSKDEVAQSLKLFPQLLHMRLENLRRKIQFFDSIGLERERVAKIIARWPLLFGQSMEKKLRPKIEMLQSLGVGRDGIAKILTRYPELRAVSLEDNLKQKVAFFEENGLTGKRLVKLMTSHPRALTLSVNELNNKLDFLVQQGFSPGSVEMVRALGVCMTISVESMAARFVNLESLGFSPEEGRQVVKQQPAILSLSEKGIQDKVHYLLNDMHRCIDEIVKCPGFLLYSLEHRIKPRHRVLSLLKSEGVLREEAYSLNTIMILSEKRFMERFVISLGAQFPQVAAAYYNRG